MKLKFCQENTLNHSPIFKKFGFRSEKRRPCLADGEDQWEPCVLLLPFWARDVHSLAHEISSASYQYLIPAGNRTVRYWKYPHRNSYIIHLYVKNNFQARFMFTRGYMGASWPSRLDPKAMLAIGQTQIQLLTLTMALISFPWIWHVGKSMSTTLG